MRCLYLKTAKKKSNWKVLSVDMKYRYLAIRKMVSHFDTFFAIWIVWIDSQLLASPEDIQSHCTQPCEFMFPDENGCGHKCSGTCGTCLMGSLHQKCEEKCSRPLICGHLWVKPATDHFHSVLELREGFLLVQTITWKISTYRKHSRSA